VRSLPHTRPNAKGPKQGAVTGIDGFVVPVILLDADHPDNTPKDRHRK